MTRNAAERKKIHEQMVAERGTGSQMAAERRAIGEALTARRTGAGVVDDINAVIRPVAERRTLRTIEPRGGLGPQPGRGVYKPPPAAPGQGGGGIASPLVETDYNAREWWPEKTVTSVDGLLSFRIRPIKEITQQDANSATVKQQYAEPVAP